MNFSGTVPLLLGANISGGSVSMSILTACFETGALLNTIVITTYESCGKFFNSQQSFLPFPPFSYCLRGGRRISQGFLDFLRFWRTPRFLTEIAITTLGTRKKFAGTAPSEAIVTIRQECASVIRCSVTSIARTWRALIQVAMVEDLVC